MRAAPRAASVWPPSRTQSLIRSAVGAVLLAVQRLQTRDQYAVAMAAGTVSRTAHFALHRLMLAPQAPVAGLGVSNEVQALFAVCAPWVGVVIPKRWAKRAVTRNGIKRQIYTVSATLESPLPSAAHVVRLRSSFAREQFPSAWSQALARAVRGELLQLFERARA